MLSRTLQVLRNRRRRPAVLLVEDEPSERFTIEEALLKAGHRVIAEAHAEGATDLLRNTGYPLAALVTSVELNAGGSGWELAKLARQLRPGIPVVYLTRFSEGAWAHQGVPDSRIVHKPSDPSLVVSAVKALLKHDGDGAGRAPADCQA